MPKSSANAPQLGQKIRSIFKSIIRASRIAPDRPVARTNLGVSASAPLESTDYLLTLPNVEQGHLEPASRRGRIVKGWCLEVVHLLAARQLFTRLRPNM